VISFVPTAGLKTAASSGLTTSFQPSVMCYDWEAEKRADDHAVGQVYTRPVSLVSFAYPPRRHSGYGLRLKVLGSLFHWPLRRGESSARNADLSRERSWLAWAGHYVTELVCWRPGR